MSVPQSIRPSDLFENQIRNYRVDDAEAIINSIKMIKGVLTVKAEVADPDTYTAYARAKAELSQRLWDVLKDQ